MKTLLLAIIFNVTVMYFRDRANSGFSDEFIGGLLTSRPYSSQLSLSSRFYRSHTFPPFGLEFCRASRRHSGSLRLLLILSGDVELNPGPVSQPLPSASTHHMTSRTSRTYLPPTLPYVPSPCLKCKKVVSLTDRQRECGLCTKKTHFVCLYVAPVSSYRAITGIINHQNFMYICDPCRSSKNSADSSHIIPQSHPSVDVLTQTNSASISPQVLSHPPIQQHPGPSTMTRSTSTAHDPEDFIIVKGPQNPLSNFYRFRFNVNGLNFFNLEQAYQYFKALKCGAPNTARFIFENCTNSVDCKHAVRGLSLNENVALALMRMLLAEKALQCPQFIQALLDTRVKRILHSTYPNDSELWCTKLHHKDIEAHKVPISSLPGRNMHGVLLEDLRSRLPLNATPIRRPLPLCLVCGKAGHATRNCRAIGSNLRCFICKNPGHAMRNCFFYQAAGAQSPAVSYAGAVSGWS